MFKVQTFRTRARSLFLESRKRVAGIFSGSLWRAVAAVAIALICVSCAYPTRNVALNVLDDRQGYRWGALNVDEDTLVIVTASGGGTRAAALAASVLHGMEQIILPSNANLANNVDIISSVSGGSVTAAYFALKGPEGLDTLEQGFIRQDGIGALAWRGLNPLSLAALSTPSKERIDVLIDYLDDRLFRDATSRREATFQTLLDRHLAPLLILNAADMVEGIPFAFTQDNFDLLCSDLSKVKLSTAVAASAAFPVALSPVTLKNYSHCAAQQGHPWPPLWVQNAAKTDWYENPVRAARGRAATAYAVGAVGAGGGKQYIHLLDGGIADNLGISEPFRLLTTDDVSPLLRADITSGKIKKIVFVMINARSFADSKLDQQQATPGILDMLLASINSGIDQTTFSTAQRLRTLLGDEFLARARDFSAAGFPATAANFSNVNANTFLIPIDFDAIDDTECRDRFHNIGTSWTLDKQQIDALMVAGKALLMSAPNFDPMLQSLGARVQGEVPKTSEACEIIARK